MEISKVFSLNELRSRFVLAGMVFLLVTFNSVFAQYKIMPLGNSITKGIGSSVENSGGYRDDLAVLLNDGDISFTYVGSQSDDAGNHEGHPGYTVSEINTVLDGYLSSSNPDIILLHIGTNDISQNFTNSTIVNNINTLVNKVYNYNSSTIILLSSVLPRIDDKDAITTELNSSISTFVANKKLEGVNIHYVGQNEAFKDNSNWATEYMWNYLHPNDDGYEVMAGEYYDVLQVALHSVRPVNIVDNFNHSELGSDWAADPEFQIVNGELANTATNTNWNYMAVYKQQQNPSQVSFTWGDNADATGINSGGLALMLDNPSQDANGYLVWKHTNNKFLDIWTIENGVPAQSLPSIEGRLSAPSAGDVFTVVIRTDDNAHRFDCFINGEYDGTVIDSNKLQGNGSTLYAGVMLKGNLNNNVDDFGLIGDPSGDPTPPAAVADLGVGSRSSSFIELTWTAPGDDGMSGTASSYDIRYSTSPISSTNFSSAIIADNTPTPSAAGSQESFYIHGLAPGTTYYFALKSLDDVGNISLISNEALETTFSDGVIVDDFNRSSLGTDWAADPEYQIFNNELSNTSTSGSWTFLATYKAPIEAVQASITWGGTADATGINAGGLALKLDAASPNANGYLVWRHTSTGKLDLWTIENGAASSAVNTVDGQLSAPVAGDEFSVLMSSDASGHHFDCYINGRYDGRLTDQNKVQGNNSTLFAGIMLRGDVNNNVDDFTLSREILLDTTPPAAITNLMVNNEADSFIELTWTAPGDDGNSGTASNYDLRYSTSPITEANFASATAASGIPAPASSGAIETASVSGLQVGVRYYFALKTMDEANNTSSISNVVSATPVIDETPPAAVTSLEVGSEVSTSVLLTWFAPGDDGSIGTASSYDIRYSTNFITEANFNSANQVLGEPQPSVPGEEENFLVPGLEPGTTYYLALKTSDESGNISALSNIVIATTLTSLTFVDDFNRSSLGSNWTADPEYGIASNEFSNTSSSDTWDYLAVYNAKKNPLEVSFKWGTGVDAPGIDRGGMALMLNSASVNASGYLVWRRTSSANLYLYTIENGKPGVEVTHIPSLLSPPQAGDEFRVVIRSDASGHYFDCYINGQFDGTISDVSKSQGNNSSRYAGIMLKGGWNNNVDDFTITNLMGAPSELVHSGGINQTGVGGQSLAEPFEVTLYDENYNPIPDIEITFRVKQGGGTLDGSVLTEKSVVSNSEGKAYVTYTLGRDGVTQIVEASSLGITSIDLTSTATSGVASSLVYVSGNDQTGTVATSMSQPMVVKVVDQAGNPMTGITVNFAITQGSGNPAPSLSVQSAQTDFNGQASTVLTLGTVAGIHKVEASVTGLSGSPVTFNATAVAGEAQNFVYESGNNQRGVGGQTLSQPFVVKVTDQYSNGKVGISVSFQVTEGSGTLSSTEIITNAEGKASTFLTLATDVDTNKVEASSAGLQGSPIEFSAFANSGIANKIVYISGNNQTATVRSPLSDPIEVKILDNVDQVVANHKVIFEVKTGGGKIEGETTKEVFTDQNGLAQVIWTLGETLASTEGINTLEASAINGSSALTNSPVQFTATAVVPKIEMVTGNGQSGAAGEPLNEPFVVRVTDRNGNPYVGQKVTFSITKGQGHIDGNSSVDIVTGEDGKASIVLTLGPADGQLNEVIVSSHVDGVSLEGSTLIFQASSGAVTDLVSVSGNNQSGSAGQPLSDPFKVRVLNNFNMPVKNYPVTFSVTEGDGTIAGTTEKVVQTDENGYASTILTLGTTPGQTNKVSVRAVNGETDLAGSPLEFEAVSSRIKEIKMVAGDSQVGTVAMPLPMPLKVKVMDDLGKSPKGFPVTFVVTDGNGNLDGETTKTILTGENGNAETILTLGSLPGSNNNIVTASAVFEDSQVNGSPITFHASGIMGPATELVYVSGDSQKGVVGSNLVDPLKVKVIDNAGNPLNNHPVTFTITSGEGRLDGTSETVITKNTNSDGFAEVIWTLGVENGNTRNSVEASSSYNDAPLEGSPITFTATVLPSTAAEIELVSGDSQEGLAGRTLVNPFKVRVTDTNGNGTSGHPVDFKIMEGSGTLNGPVDTVETVLTDESGYAEVLLTLGEQAGIDNIVHASSVNGPEDLIGSPIIFTASSKTGAVDAVVSTVVCSPGSLSVDESVGGLVTVTLTDSYGNPVQNKIVMLTSSGDDILEQPSNPTDANGQAFGSVKSTKAGLRLISARDVTDALDLANPGQIIFVPLSASELVQVSGGNQEGNIGTALLDPLKARITDKYGNAIVNFPIHFNVLGGGGTIFENQPMYTDSSGEASATFVLGRETSVNNLAEARVEGLNNSSVLFMASVTDNSAQTLSRVSGNSQSGSAGFVLPEPFIVRVTDENNKPVWNFPVEFEVTEGNGLFYGESSKIIRTDYAGYASAQFVLARELGTNRASVLANGLSGSPLSFSAQGTVGEAARLQYVQGDSQTVEVNSQLPLALKVQVTDFYGNGIGSYPVLFNIIEGEAQFLENQQQITDTNGFASISMQLGHTAGPVIVEAQALDLIDSSVQFLMEATALCSCVISSLLWLRSKRYN